MKITKIVVTGGPCAGKSTAMSWIQNAFTQKGYTVLFVPETATEFISGGVCPWTCGTNEDYQKCQMELQLTKERLFQRAAATMPADKVLIVCDRGAMDNKAYMNDEEFAHVLSFLGLDEVRLRDDYDAVFHLVTAAKGAEEFYTTANNQARYETVEEAVAIDDKLLASWTGHPHLRIIDNTTDFSQKMRRLINEISTFLGAPMPCQEERRFLIEYPDVEALEKMPNCRRIEIIQTYLRSNNGDEIRVRQRGMNGSYIYYQTIKRRVSETERVEIERRLTQDEYLEMLMEADTTRRPIRKTRYCLTCGIESFVIDLYPFWKDQALAEVDLCAEDELRIPDCIKVIKEVTGDDNYSNYVLANRGW